MIGITRRCKQTRQAGLMFPERIFERGPTLENGGPIGRPGTNLGHGFDEGEVKLGRASVRKVAKCLWGHISKRHASKNKKKKE